MMKIFAFLSGIFFVAAAMAADVPRILSDVDARLYQQIFILQDKEKIDTAIKVQNQIADKLLFNEILYQRYVSDTYRTRGKEIESWMEQYYDMPGAQRMEKLAKIKKAVVRKARVPNMISGSESQMMISVLVVCFLPSFLSLILLITFCSRSYLRAITD